MTANNTGVEFVDGLPRGAGGGGRKGIWIERLAPLVKRPGHWAIIGRESTSAKASAVATNLTLGRLNIPPGEWEFAGRTVDGEPRVYGRYLGDGGDE